MAPSAILGLTIFSISHDLLKDDLIVLPSKFYCNDALIQMHFWYPMTENNTTKKNKKTHVFKHEYVSFEVMLLKQCHSFSAVEILFKYRCYLLQP